MNKTNRHSWSRRLLVLLALLAALVMLMSVAVGSSAAQTGGDDLATNQSDFAWYARYWSNMNFQGEPVVAGVQSEPINFDWGFESPDPLLDRNNFSVRWTAQVQFEPGLYRFRTVSDDGVRVWLDDEYVINNFTTHPATTNEAIVELDGARHSVAVDYFENTGRALISFEMEKLEPTGVQSVTIAPTSGPVGTVIDVEASGFPANSEVFVGIGRANAEPVTGETVVTDEAGNVNTAITVPSAAEPGEPWRVLVNANGISALSGNFTVTGQPGAGDLPCGETYVVQPGDWLSRIARRCDTTVDALLAANPQIQNADIVNPGMELTMPAAEEDLMVEIRPNSGPVGTVVSIAAVGMVPNESVAIEIAAAGAAPSVTQTVQTSDTGVLDTSIIVPQSADPGEQWVVTVTGTQQTASSDPFTVTAPETGEGDQNGTAAITITPQIDLRLRSGPSVENEIIDIVPADATLTALARDQNSQWVQVTYQGNTGWIWGPFATISGGTIQDLPVG